MSSRLSVSEEFTSETEATGWMDDYLSRYPEFGYGTHLVLSEKLPDQLWKVHGYRYSSCD